MVSASTAAIQAISLIRPSLTTLTVDSSHKGFKFDFFRVIWTSEIGNTFRFRSTNTPTYSSCLRPSDGSLLAIAPVELSSTLQPLLWSKLVTPCLILRF